MNVLLIEDSDAGVTVLRQAVAPLVQGRLHIVHVSSLKAGIQRLREEAVSGVEADEGLDVVLSDLHLPGIGLGQEVTRVRDLYGACVLAGVPLVLISVRVIDAVSRAAFVTAGVERVLHKGADLDVFGQQLYHALIEVSGSNARRKGEGMGPMRQLQRAILSEVACLHAGQQTVQQRLQRVGENLDTHTKALATRPASAGTGVLRAVLARLRRSDPRALVQLVVLLLWVGMIFARFTGLWAGEVPTYTELQQRLGMGAEEAP